MHDDYTGGQVPSVRKTEPLRGAPPRGTWALWHGPQAEAVVELARTHGQALRSPPDLPPPEGFPAPLETSGMWLLDHGGQRYFLRAEVQNKYLSCYLFNMTE